MLRITLKFLHNKYKEEIAVETDKFKENMNLDNKLMGKILGFRTMISLA